MDDEDENSVDWQRIAEERAKELFKQDERINELIAAASEMVQAGDELRAENERLKADNKSLLENYDYKWKEDAERWRWVRQYASPAKMMHFLKAAKTAEEVDAAIDAAKKE